MTISNEQRLSICKFLAEKIGKEKVCTLSERVSFAVKDSYRREVFNPFTNQAQRMEVIDAAVADKLNVDMHHHDMSVIFPKDDGLHIVSERHDNTPESRAEAVLVAIAKAWGYES